MPQVSSDVNKQSSLELRCVNLKGEIIAESCWWVWNIKIPILLILLCQSILETRRITHLHGSAHFTIPLTESTCETRKKVIYFIWKAFFVIEIIKFELLRYSNVMTSASVQTWNTKQILLNNLRSKHSLVIKFGQFM